MILEKMIEPLGFVTEGSSTTPKTFEFKYAMALSGGVRKITITVMNRIIRIGGKNYSILVSGETNIETSTEIALAIIERTSEAYGVTFASCQSKSLILFRDFIKSSLSDDDDDDDDSRLDRINKAVEEEIKKSDGSVTNFDPAPVINKIVEREMKRKMEGEHQQRRHERNPLKNTIKDVMYPDCCSGTCEPDSGKKSL